MIGILCLYLMQLNNYYKNNKCHCGRNLVIAHDALHAIVFVLSMWVIHFAQKISRDLSVYRWITQQVYNADLMI